MGWGGDEIKEGEMMRKGAIRICFSSVVVVNVVVVVVVVVVVIVVVVVT